MYRFGATHVIQNTGAKHTATVIFLHGSGGSGENLKDFVQFLLNNFSFPHIKLIFPTAPLQPYSFIEGRLSTVWFDRFGISPANTEKIYSINNNEGEIRNLIRAENELGIDNSRIILAGFSMGGTLVLHAAYRWLSNINSVVVFNTFLNNHSMVYEALKRTSLIRRNGRTPLLLQLHGEDNSHVILKWSLNTFNELKRLRVRGEFNVLEHIGHTINTQGLLIMKAWVEKHLPEI